MSIEEKIVKLLNTLPHRLCVKFALLCAEDVAHLVEDNGEAQRCRDLVKAWLEGKDVTAKEFIDASNICTLTASTAARTSYTRNVAYYAAHSSATVCYTIAYYTIAYANATYTSFHYYAVARAAKGLGTSEDKYYDILINMIKDLSPLEQAIYNVEEM